jgi:protocatechuate 3,4-dioxygenase beta subunit
MSISRRSFVRKIAGKIGGGAMVGLASTSVVAADTCSFLTTPAQPEGPFYPLRLPADTNADLTTVIGNSKIAFGEIIIVKGVVTDENCNPVKGAIVEVWQACDSGRYNHPSDTSTAKLDPNFQYYAQIKTNSKGEYSYKTILPGKYDANSTWTRPPHIHYKVSLRGYEELITQLYFKGEKLNDFDRILQSLNKDEQSEVVIDFKASATQKFRSGQFNIKLKKL